MNFKFFQEKDDFNLTFGQNLILQPIRFDGDVEFCFQFDDEEEVVFANGPNELIINISPTPNGNMIFNHNGRTFKILARQRVNNEYI